MSIYEEVKGRTESVEATFYALLDRLDEYRETLERFVAELEAAPEPNVALIKRFRMFLRRSATMTTILEDDVLTEMLSLIDRLHAVKDTEEGKFI